MRRSRGVGTLVAPNGRPLRDEAAHRAFRRNQVASREHVLWHFPEIEKVENKTATLKEIAEKLEHEPNHSISIEVGRIFGIYKADLLKCLEAHERKYNKGSMPEVAIVREGEPRYPIIHAAMHCFCCAWQEVLIDATEETDLLHPDAK